MASLVPTGAWDTHTHVFDPEKFPYPQKRSYTPKAAQLIEYPSKSTGCRNVVIVHASVQGSSPAPLVDTLEKDPQNLRGLATIVPSELTDAQVDKLHAKGVRGARFHKMAWGHGAQSDGADILQEIIAVAKKTARLGWVIDVFCPISVWAHMADAIRQLDPRIKVVADHFGGTFPGEEMTKDFEIFLSLIREGKVTVKLSGFERLYDGKEGGIDAIEPIAKAIIEAGPDQIIYGSDWPHTLLGVSRQGKTDEERLRDIEGFRDVPDEEHIRKLREWIPDDATWQKLFVTNPMKIFQ